MPVPVPAPPTFPVGWSNTEVGVILFYPIVIACIDYDLLDFGDNWPGG
jgi:hypothetical protein